MSWKNTDPVELWKTSTTLPIPAKKVQSTEEDLNRFGNARVKFWMSLNEMSPKRRTEFFQQMLNIWPYAWERRAIKWSINMVPFASFISSAYITTKIMADVFMVNQKKSFFQIIASLPTKSPFIVLPCVTLASQFICYEFLYKPYIEHEGQISTRNFIYRAAGISLIMGIAFPLFFVPPLANSAFYLEQRKMGMRPLPEGSVVDLITQTFECSRSVRSKLHLIAVANLLCAGITVAAMIWAREKIHNTIDLDPELIRTLMTDKEELQQARKSRILESMAWLRNMSNTPFARALDKKTLIAPSSWQEVDETNNWLRKLERLFIDDRPNNAGTTDVPDEDNV